MADARQAKIPIALTAWRGARLRCPACGRRTLFRAYLKLNERCPRCGADFSHSETADVAPYLTVFLIGLIATPLTLLISVNYGAPGPPAIALLVAAIIALALALLPRVKGALAALLWRAQREM